MTIKVCTCAKPVTTQNVKRVTFTYAPEIKKAILWFDCSYGGPTLILRASRPHYKGVLRRNIKE